MKKIILLITITLITTLCFGQENKAGDYLIKSGNTFYIGAGLGLFGGGLIIAATQIKPVEKKSINGTTTFDNSKAQSFYAFGAVVSAVGAGVIIASFSNLILAGKELNKQNKKTAFIINNNGAGISYSFK